MTEPLECLTQEAINNRFVGATESLERLFFKDFETRRVEELMKRKGMTKAKARKIMKAEDKKALEEYNSPLAVANRKVEQLEAHLQLIKDVIADPNHCECL